MALATLYGAAALPIYGIAVAHANDYAAHEERVAVSAGLLLTYGLGAILAPTVAGAAMDMFGPTALFGYTAVMSAALGGFCLYRMGRRTAKPLGEQAPFAPVPATTPVAAQLDPRAEPADAGPAADRS